MENYGGYYDRSAPELQNYQTADGSEYENTAVDETISESEIYSEQLKAFLPHKRYAHPLIILALLVMCFPIGLIAMLCFTKWGAFPKILVTLFVLAVAVAVYEILVAKQIIALPGLIELIGGLFSQTTPAS